MPFFLEPLIRHDRFRLLEKNILALYMYMCIIIFSYWGGGGNSTWSNPILTLCDLLIHYKIKMADNVKTISLFNKEWNG